MRRAVVVSLAVLVLLVAGAVAAYVVYKTRVQAHSVQGSSTVEFVTTAAPKPPRIKGAIEWPNFGNGWNQPRVGPGITQVGRGDVVAVADDHRVALERRAIGIEVPAGRWRARDLGRACLGKEGEGNRRHGRAKGVRADET